jgi:hypothetical protein
MDEFDRHAGLACENLDFRIRDEAAPRNFAA